MRAKIKINFLTSKTQVIMKRFLIDTYRIFLLQTSKVFWDIIGCTLLVWFVFYNSYPNGHFAIISMFGQISGIWIIFRLYWQRGKNNLEEVEALRPVSPYIKGFGNGFVVILFFLFIYVIPGLLYYNIRLGRFILWLHDYFNIQINLQEAPYCNYIDQIKRLNPRKLITQKELILSSMKIFWSIIIPLAIAMQLKLKYRIVFIIAIFIIMFSGSITIMNLIASSELKDQVIFYSIYLSMVIYLIIPKRINFK